MEQTHALWTVTNGHLSQQSQSAQPMGRLRQEAEALPGVSTQTRGPGSGVLLLTTSFTLTERDTLSPQREEAGGLKRVWCLCSW